MRKSLLVLLTAFLITGVAQAQAILGYLPEYQYYGNSNICYNKYTDIAYSFMNPTTSGDISYTSDALYGFNVNIFDAVKLKCSQNGVKLWIAIGGADTGDQRSARLSQVAGNSGTRSTFINAIVAFAVQHNLEGIDIDWEFPKTSTEIANHKQFVLDLKAKITASTKPGIKIGVTVGGEYLTNPNHLQYVDQAVFNSADFVNLMTYDFPVGHPSAGVHHSSVANAIGSMTAWNTQKGVPFNKIRLGLPFYGKGSTNRNANGGGMAFSQLFANNSNAVNTNNVAVNGTTYYYNGKTELEDKITQAFAKGINGVMVWDIAQDNSACVLSNIVYDKVNSTCAAPQPNLGLDVSVCKAGDTKIFNANVAPGPGNVVKWYKDEVLIANAISQTYTASAAGTYKVVYSTNTCSKQDAAVLSVGSSITTQGTTVCAGSDATVSIVSPATGTNFSWWDAAIGGTQLATGTRSYTATAIAGSKNVYAQEESATGINKSIGVPLLTEGPSGTYYRQLTKLGQFAHFIDVKQNINIKSVDVFLTYTYVDGTTVKVVIYDSNGKTIIKSSTPQVVNVTAVGPYGYEKVEVIANLDLLPGQYFICVEGTAPSYSLTKTDGQLQTLPQADMDIKDGSTVVMTMQGKSVQRFSATGFINLPDPEGGLSDSYGQVFNIQVTTGAAASNCGRALAAITVNPAPAAPGAITFANSSVCAGTSNAAISVSTVPSATSYVWSYSGTGATFAGTSANTSVSFAGNATSGDIKVAAKGDCGISAESVAKSVTINGASALTLSTAGTNLQTVCTGVAITNIKYDLVNATNPTVIGLPAGVTGALSAGVFTISGTPTASGTFNYTVSATGSCNSPSATGTITVNAKPATPGTITGAASITNTGTPVTSPYSIATVAGATSYTWTFTPSAGVTFSASTISGGTVSTNATFTTGSASGIMSVTATSNNCTSAASTKTVSVITDAKDDLLANGFAVSPNPSASEFNLKIATATNVELVVYNSLGQIVTAISDTTDNLTFGAGLQQGVYYAKVSVGGITSTYKLVKE